MDTDGNSASQPERKPRSGPIWTLVLMTVFLVLLFLLGRSMVKHRFFQGGRVHPNGSVGQ
jgi:hypothetical protein